MNRHEKQKYPFTDTENVDEALDRYKEIHAGLVDMALEEFDDSNDPAGTFRSSARESMKRVENADAGTSDKTSAIYAILHYTFKLCEGALANRGLRMEIRTVYESMAYTYSAACNYGW